MQGQKTSFFLKLLDSRWIGMALIGAVIALDTYLKAPVIISSRYNNLDTLKIVLAENPVFDEFRVAEFTYDYNLKLKDHDKNFICSRCSYQSLNLEIAMKLKAGDTIRLIVFKNDGVNYVFGMDVKENAWILDYGDVVSCEKSKWKKLLGFSVVIILLVISNSTIRYFKVRAK